MDGLPQIDLLDAHMRYDKRKRERGSLAMYDKGRKESDFFTDYTNIQL